MQGVAATDEVVEITSFVFFARNELVDDAVSTSHCLLVPRHVATHPLPLASAL